MITADKLKFKLKRKIKLRALFILNDTDFGVDQCPLLRPIDHLLLSFKMVYTALLHMTLQHFFVLKELFAMFTVALALLKFDHPSFRHIDRIQSICLYKEL